MRTAQILLFGLLAGVVASVPVVVHAAAYKKYTSATCGYTMDAPAGWRATSSGTTVTFGGATSSITYRAIIVDCTKSGVRVTARSLTKSERQAFGRQKYRLSSVNYAGNAGIFTGHKIDHTAGKTIQELVEVTSFPAGRRGYVIALAADRKSFAAALAVYTHILSSFRAK